jgi:hypothetical protein
MCAITVQNLSFKLNLDAEKEKKRQTTRGKICFGGQMDMVNC